MSFEPQKFFVGLIDFFSVLLPGALLTYLIKDETDSWPLGQPHYDRLAGANCQVRRLFYLAVTRLINQHL